MHEPVSVCVCLWTEIACHPVCCALPPTSFHQELRQTRHILEVREQKLMDLSQANANLNADNDGLRRCACTHTHTHACTHIHTHTHTHTERERE